MADDRPDVTDVSRFWDQLFRGEQPTAGLSDPDLAEVVHHLQSLAAAPVPTAARARARARVLVGSIPVMEPVAAPPPLIGANGRSPRVLGQPALSSAPHSRGQLGAAFATALLLLLILAGLYVAFRPFDDPAVVAPVIEATPTTSAPPTLTSEIVLDLAFPAGAIPIDDRGFFVFNRYSVGPGFGFQYPDTCDTPALVVSLVESGTFSVRATGPFDVIWGDNATEPGTRQTIAPDTEAVLAPGDALVYANTTADLFDGFENPGATPLVVLEAVWFPSAECVVGPPGGMNVAWDTYDVTPGIDPTRPVVLTLRHLTAEPGATLTDGGPDAVDTIPAGDRILERVYIEAGTVEVTGLPPPAGATPEATGSTIVTGGMVGVGGFAAIDLDAPPDSGPVVLRNVGVGPLVATVLTIRYAPP